MICASASCTIAPSGHAARPTKAKPLTVEQQAIMEPGNLCSKLLHNCPVGPRRREGAHVLEIARRESLHVGKGVEQISGQAVDHPGTPALMRRWSPALRAFG
jgi:hypothetical protein